MSYNMRLAYLTDDLFCLVLFFRGGVGWGGGGGGHVGAKSENAHACP